MATQPELIYVGDPMCSWCWGFSPTLERLMARYPDRFSFSLIVGGLRPGPAAAKLDEGMKAYLAHHWRQVDLRSGQPFDYAFLERNDFVYDTEPSCRAVVTVRRMVPNRTFQFMEAVHRAFYARNLDPTRTETFLEIASSMDLAEDEFRKLYGSEELVRETERDFLAARQMGVHGFPSTLLRENDDPTPIPLTRGWVSWEEMESILAPWVADSSS
jgi:putative protein-disulfide isomerase